MSDDWDTMPIAGEREYRTLVVVGDELLELALRLRAFSVEALESGRDPLARALGAGHREIMEAGVYLLRLAIQLPDRAVFALDVEFGRNVRRAIDEITAKALEALGGN